MVREISYNSDDYQQLLQLRYDVLRAPLNLTFSEAFLARDKDNILIAAFDGERVVGCCQLEKMQEDVYQLRQMAVAFDYQGKGVGKQVVDYAEQIAKQKGAEKIELHARDVAKGFYQKLGYHLVGDKYYEIGLPHYTMIKKLVHE